MPVLFTAGLVANACGGKAADTTDSTDAAVHTDGAPGPRSADCPESAPADHAPCTKKGVSCEYGDDYNAACNHIVTCSDGRWETPFIYGGGNLKCPSGGPPVKGPNPSDCAATREAVPEGKACSTKSTCRFDGATCTCGVACSNYPVRMPDCNPDAGVTTNCCDKNKIVWNCFDGPTYCPVDRPRVGTACTKDGDSCAFDEAVECGQTVLECSEGKWQVRNDGCPISTSRAKKDIGYVDEAGEKNLHDATMSVRLATYRYKNGDDASHLGFVIEDMPPGSPAVLASRDRVDLYGYVSMAVASLQQQQKEIDRLKNDVARLQSENAALKKRR